MCEKLKGLHNRIDMCIRPFILNLNLMRDKSFKILACCCGHNKYPLTIVVSDGKKIFELVSGKAIPRTRNFYKSDGKGFYYIPETMK